MAEAPNAFNRAVLGFLADVDAHAEVPQPGTDGCYA